ncbi:tyrosine-type recombinase/integrase [Bradyrhizobium sp. Ash2021]|uniref:tyrosine-type recombinase/integrase n=1 Tax=Bradyrhizobium sp. Ash2021 TaxID=2954771 RepID=UPI002816653B|nr:tyrosine-type recombinase/integrase [Bradyrhizobium sp. Ash2021]WMT73865.1 tyrosine-type recombinase/integrase [Bradyrhizobium sp. Ash2021]
MAATNAKARYISTVTQVENLKPREERYEVADANLRRNRLVVFPSGAKSWVHRYRFGGRTRKLTLDCGATDLARARELGAAAMKAVSAKIDPAAEKQEKKHAPADITVDGLVTLYLDRHVYKRNQKGVAAGRVRKKAPLRSGSEIERILRKELKPFRNRLAAEGVSAFEAKKLIDDVAERGHVMRNRTLTNCKALYAFGMSERLVRSSPFAGLKLTDEDTRERVLSTKELRAVWTAAGKLGHPYTGMIRLLILTGQRLNEIAGLRWAEIDLAKRQIELPGTRTKNGRPHIVALSDAAAEILESAPKVGSDEGLVLTVTGARLNGWSKMRKRLAEATTAALDGVEPAHWTLHDIRRTFATRMAEDLKVSPHVVDKILNHSSGVVRGVAAIYNRAELLNERSAALGAWGRYVDELVDGSPSNVVALRG